MSSPITLHPPRASTGPVPNALQRVLSGTYGLYLVTHNYHWNVEGENFYQMHKLFEEQYRELIEAIDVIAERIRALDEYALPFEGAEIMDISRETSNALNKENDAGERADRMMANLITLNEAIVRDCQMAKAASQSVEDDETENLMIVRIMVHQKSIWKLRSQLK